LWDKKGGRGLRKGFTSKGGGYAPRNLIRGQAFAGDKIGKPKTGKA